MLAKIMMMDDDHERAAAFGAWGTSVLVHGAILLILGWHLGPSGVRSGASADEGGCDGAAETTTEATRDATT